VLLNQNGLVKEWIAQIAFVRSKLAAVWPLWVLAPRPPKPMRLSEETSAVTVPGRTLEVRDLIVRYDGMIAVDAVSATIKPGRILGLIGPNGAGKTTLIDAVTGFKRIAGGTLLLDGQDIAGWSPARRARAGLGRSFQSLELFEDSTVLDNLRSASDPHDLLSYLRDLVYPKEPPLSGEVVSVIREFRLESDLDRLVEDLPYGQRRLLAIARAVASRPSILLLDEPAAGLDDLESAELAHVVRRLADDWGIGVLLVEHDVDFVMSVCDEIVVLDFGHKIGEGVPERVRNDPAVIAAYLGQPEEAVEHSEQASHSSSVSSSEAPR
jgi:sulfate-transporting ATPase